MIDKANKSIKWNVSADRKPTKEELLEAQAEIDATDTGPYVLCLPLGIVEHLKKTQRY
jgi:hypothetical protein